MTRRCVVVLIGLVALSRISRARVPRVGIGLETSCLGHAYCPVEGSEDRWMELRRIATSGPTTP